MRQLTHVIIGAVVMALAAQLAGLSAQGWRYWLVCCAALVWYASKPGRNVDG